MKNKSVQYWLFVSIVALSVIALGIVLIVSLGQDATGTTLDVSLEPGETIGTVALVNVSSTYQYSFDEGQTWNNVPSQTTRVDNLVAQEGDVILVRDTARAGFSQSLTVQAEDIAS